MRIINEYYYVNGEEYTTGIVRGYDVKNTERESEMGLIKREP